MNDHNIKCSPGQPFLRGKIMIIRKIHFPCGQNAAHPVSDPSVPVQAAAGCGHVPDRRPHKPYITYSLLDLSLLRHFLTGSLLQDIHTLMYPTGHKKGATGGSLACSSPLYTDDLPGHPPDCLCLLAISPTLFWQN